MNDLPLDEQVRVLKSKLSHMQDINKHLRATIVTERVRNNMYLERLSADNKYLTACQTPKELIPQRPNVRERLRTLFKKRSST